MKFGWFILRDDPLRKRTIIIGFAGWIRGGLNASVASTNIKTFTTSTGGAAYGETLFVVGSMTGTLWEQIIPSRNKWMKLIYINK